MTKQETKILKLRITALEAELTDPLCQKYPAARKCVQESLDAARKQLAGK